MGEILILPGLRKRSVLYLKRTARRSASHASSGAPGRTVTHSKPKLSLINDIQKDWDCRVPYSEGRSRS